MKHCTGLMGKECTCGFWHTDGGRFVDTHRHEAPRPVPITLADDGGMLTQEGAAVLAGRVLWALRAVFVLAGAGLLVLVASVF